MSRKIVDPVAQEIERQGLEGVLDGDRDRGTELAVQYCDDLLRKERGGTGKGVCGTPLLNQIISELPIIFYYSTFFCRYSFN